MSGEGLKACPTCRAAHAMLDHYAAPTHDNCGAPMVLADRIEAKIYADDLNASTRPTPTVEGGELVERLRAMASTGGRITCMAEYFGGAVMPSNLIAARLCADAADALASRDAEIERLSAALGEAERAINRAKEAVEDQDDIELVGSLDAALSTLKTAREGNNE